MNSEIFQQLILCVWQVRSIGKSADVDDDIKDQLKIMARSMFKVPSASECLNSHERQSALNA